MTRAFLTCHSEAVAFLCLDATWAGTNIEAEEVASTVAPGRRNGGANAQAEHVHRRSHTSPERRNRAPACLHGSHATRASYAMVSVVVKQAQILKQRRLPRLSHPYGEMAEPTLQPIMSTEEATHRRRGGIEPLRVSTPHELKSCPSTSLTHPGLHDRSLPHVSL